jgi:hypothetical protein
MIQMLAASDADGSCVPWGARVGSVVRVASARERVPTHGWDYPQPRRAVRARDGGEQRDEWQEYVIWGILTACAPALSATANRDIHAHAKTGRGRPP